MKKNGFHRGCMPLVGEILKKMKITIFMICISVLSSFAIENYAQSTKLTLEFENTSIRGILNSIESQSEFKFFYSSKVDVERKATVNQKNKKIFDILDELFEETGIKYEVYGRQIALLAGGEIYANPEQLVAEQQKTISGIITDATTGEALIGVAVYIPNTNTGVVSDANGKYSLNAPALNTSIIFSFVGYVKTTIVYTGQSNVDVKLVSDVKAIDEVIVTALGIKKSSKSLGYATANVNSDQLTVNRTPNLMNTLSGKMAGVSISSLGTGPAGTSKIRIRGQSSISGQNSPLIVINGVPIDNANFGAQTGNTGDGSTAPRGAGITSDGGDGLSSINPDDIENMTVLKGAAAAALYGSRAKDGVIMITTKSKGNTKGIGVTWNMNLTNDNPLDYTDWQYEYGQGENGIRPTTANPTSGQWSFGEKIQPGMTQVLFNNLTVPYVAQKGIIKDFYRHGQSLTNTVSLSANSEKGGMNLSISNTSSDGIVPNNNFERKTINLGFDYYLTDKLSFKGNINYSNEINNNPPNVANQDNNIPTVLLAMANTMPLSVLEANKYNDAGNEYIYSRFQNRTNPYFTLAEQFNRIRRDRLFGNVSIKYNILKWLSAQARIGQDYWSRDQEYDNYPTGHASLSPAPVGFVNGLYTQEARTFRETNLDFLVTAAKEFGNIGVNMNVGGNQMKRRSDLNSVQVTDFVIRGLYTVQNGRAKDPIYDLSERGVNSLYGAAEVNYKQYLYLNATLRNDWFSTLSVANRSIIYPSVSASYVISESLSSTPSWLDFAKLRAAYAEVGSDTDVPPYSNLLFYGVNSQTLGGQPIANFGSTVPNPNLKPMRTAETELGLELKLFKSRVGLDLAVYHKITSDQIVNAQISDGSGYSSTRINSGQSQNNGIEIMLNLVPVESTNFHWDLTFTSAYNKTKVLSLLTDTPGESITVGTHAFDGSVQQIVGEEMGQIVGFGYRTNESGQRVYGANGIPLATTKQMAFGSALPKWVGGFTNNFNYKGVSFSFLIDFKLGNKMLSGTNFNAYRHGLQKVTLEGREGGVIGVGVNEKNEPNTVSAKVQDYWSVVRSSKLIEPVIYNGGYWKLRQITIGYDFSKFIPASIPIKGLKLNLLANNVLMLKKWVDNIDPESFGYSSDNLVGMESPGLPTTRTLGFNLNVKF
jgi:TonB-linked SusC/RagA family outer membrane protein